MKRKPLTYEERILPIEDIYDETFQREQLTLYKILWNDVSFDFLIHYVKKSEQMVALGTGTMSNRELPLPFFARLSWYPDFPVTAVWYGDPTFYEGDLPLYWYYGNSRHWYLESIAFLLSFIMEKLGVQHSDLLCFGSSGGGYSSLVLATLLHSKATVINPQFILSNYNETYYQRFLKDRCEEGEKPLRARTEIAALIQREDYFPRIYMCPEYTGRA